MTEGTNAPLTAAEIESFHSSTLFVNGLDSSNWDKFDMEYIEALTTGGINALNITTVRPHNNFRNAATSYMLWRRRLSEYMPEHVLIVNKADDIERAQAEGKIAVILGFQGGNPIEDELALLEIFHLLGIRIFQLTYNRRNFIGDGVAETEQGGLSVFGRSVVKELNRLGMVVDLAHVGERTALDALHVSETPAIVSHSTARALCDHFRPITDNLMRAVAEAGGVIGVAALSIFLRNDGVTNGSTIKDYLDHLEHTIDVAGIDHVGVGFDVGFKRTDEDTKVLEGIYPEFKFPPLHLRYATELNRADKAMNVTRGLVERGYGREDIRKILGLNWMRVYRQAWG